MLSHVKGYNQNQNILQKIPRFVHKSNRGMVVVKCKIASEKLADLGYTNIVEIGGINDWTGDTVSEK